MHSRESASGDLQSLTIIPLWPDAKIFNSSEHRDSTAHANGRARAWPESKAVPDSCPHNARDKS